jgi:ABC-type xylose transport system permease subunit
LGEPLTTEVREEPSANPKSEIRNPQFKAFLRANGMLLSMLAIFAAMAFVTRLQQLNWELATFLSPDAFATGWTFVSPENLSNLSQQVTQTGILAIGMTMVILIGGIDLSVGSMLAVSAIVLAITAERFEGMGMVGPWLAILVALGAGAALGAWNGAMIARLRLLPFVVTLATLTIARGLAYLVSGSQSIRVKAEVFKVLGVHSLDKFCYLVWYRITGLPAAAEEALKQKGIAAPEWPETYVDSLFLPDKFANGLPNSAKLVPGTHFFPSFTIALFILGFAAWLVLESRSRKSKAALGYPVESDSAWTARAASVGVGFLVLGAVFASHQGVPIMVLVFAALALGASFLLNRTIFGRHLYAIGGNKDAARLSGVNVARCTFLVFTMMGLLSAMAGIVSTARSQSASPATQGVLAELEAIAAVVVGGTSLMGGIGTIGGTIIGVLIIGVVVNGMILMALPNEIQLIFKGLLIMIAVILDQKTKGSTRA